MPYHFFLFVVLFIVSSCAAPTINEAPKDYVLIEDSGIYAEQFDSTNISENRYTDNNITYVEGNTWTFDYYYEDREGKHFKFEEWEGASALDWQERSNAWSFIPIDKTTERTIDVVKLIVKPGLQPMIKNIPDYNQTIIAYDYPQVNGNKNFNSYTGVIENEKNVWMHPPRDRLFRILELNPFPFIMAPYEVGTKWDWSLKIGSFWGDKRWKLWDEQIENIYQYEIVDKREIESAVGKLECYVIQSTAKSEIGQTHLTAYFNIDKGFVKLDYTNIDSTKTYLNIKDFTKGIKITK